MPSNESIKDYNVYEQLGKGGFAQVYRAQVKQTGQEVAIKMVRYKFSLNKLLAAYLLNISRNTTDRQKTNEGSSNGTTS